MLLSDTVVVFVGCCSQSDGNVAVGTFPENFLCCHEGQLVVDENPGNRDGGEVVDGQGCSVLAVLEGAAGGGGVVSEDVAESHASVGAGGGGPGGLRVRGYAKISHCDA